MAIGDRPAGERRGSSPKVAKATVLILAVLTALLIVAAVVLIGIEPLATMLVAIVAVATGFMAFYLQRTL